MSAMLDQLGINRPWCYPLNGELQIS